MRNLLILLILTMSFISCDKDECTQEALATQLTESRTSTKAIYSEYDDCDDDDDDCDKVFVCHNGNTLEIDEDDLDDHLEHGDTEGECQTLSDGGLTFIDGATVEIDCKYELPFVHVRDNGEQWLYQ